MAESEYMRLDAAGGTLRECEWCKTGFVSDRKRRFCGQTCRITARDRRNGVAEWKAAPRVSQRCANCLVLFTLKASAISGGSCRGAFCSRECGHQDRTLYGHPSAGKINRWAEYASRHDKSTTRGMAAAAKLVAPFKRLFESNPSGYCPRSCRLCKVSFTSLPGLWASVYCDEECRRTAATTKAREWRARNRKRFGKSGIQRAKIAGNEWQRFDEVWILERDKWKCHICGCNTPKKLRGTFDQRAPELDHIVPIAEGGAHVPSNVRCACRECNIHKGARPMGQLGLLGFSYKQGDRRDGGAYR